MRTALQWTVGAVAVLILSGCASSTGTWRPVSVTPRQAGRTFDVQDLRLASDGRYEMDVVRDGDVLVVEVLASHVAVSLANARMVLDFGPGIGRYCYTYLRGLPQPCPTGCRMARVLKGSTCRLEYRTDNGKYFEVTASPFRDLDGRVCQLQMILRDDLAAA